MCAHKAAALLAAIFILLYFKQGDTRNVELVFEHPEDGFFLKHSQDGGEDLVTAARDDILSVDRFVVRQPSQPSSLRVSLGPFSTKQTIPARLVLPDDELINLAPNHTYQDELMAHSLDIGAHLVTAQVSPDNPVLRVLFYTSQGLTQGLRNIRMNTKPGSDHAHLCIILRAQLGSYTLESACSPEAPAGLCLAEITIPAGWWEINHTHTTPSKPVKPSVRIAYSVSEIKRGECISLNQGTRVQLQPVTPLGECQLVPSRWEVQELSPDGEVVHMLMPTGPLYPKTKAYVPVHVTVPDDGHFLGFLMRARVKSGVHLIGVEPANSNLFNVTVEYNNRQTIANVMVLILGDPKTYAGRVSAFSWVVAADERSDYWEGGRVIWSVKILTSQILSGPDIVSADLNTDRSKITTRLNLQKDDVQEVVPIAKGWELVNTALLTGRQVTEPMKVFIVSQQGKVADVTLKSACSSNDESVLKVSSSCTSVYLDGSELRGSQNATVIVKYGTHTGAGHFVVWTPLMPLDVHLADRRLSQIKSWRIKSRSNRWDSMNKISWGNSLGRRILPKQMDRSSPQCHLRFQQTRVEVYAQFQAVDHNSGRESFYLSRTVALRVTELVQSHLRVHDPRVASLTGTLVVGRAVGRTEVQVLSPVTGRVIGHREVRVGKDRVGVSRISVGVIAGLQLEISPLPASSPALPSGYVAMTTKSSNLTAMYQEGLLDAWIHFSDGTSTPLRDISPDHYDLVVESLDPTKVVYAPDPASFHPRVIALSSAHGQLLKVSVELPLECHKRKSNPLGVASVPISIHFTEQQADAPISDISGLSDGNHHRKDDGIKFLGDSDKRLSYTDLDDILVTSGGRPAASVSHHRHDSAMIHASVTTPLEVGMYVLLAVFCLAIMVFVLTCTVYAARVKRKHVPKNRRLTTHSTDSWCDQQSTTRLSFPFKMVGGRAQGGPATHAHDWVWLGRTTTERAVIPSSDFNGNRPNITSNPGFQFFLQEETPLLSPSTNSIDNPNHMQLPSNSSGPTPMRIQANPLTEGRHSPRPQGKQPPEGKKPPVPPHRGAGLTTSMMQSNIAAIPPQHIRGVKVLPSPPVPPHRIQHARRLSPSQFNAEKQQDAPPTLPDPSFLELGEESSLTSHHSNDLGLNSLALGMDYEQLVEYFDNLKESSA